MFAYLYGSSLYDEHPKDIDFAVYLFSGIYGTLLQKGEVTLGFTIPLEMKLEEKVVITGWIPREELMSVYDVADVVVIPSLFPETFSLVFLEAFSMKNIVIASDIGALSNNITHGKNGFLVKPGDAGELSERIDYVLKNMKKLESIREQAYKTSQMYKPEKYIKIYERLYS